MLLYNLLIFSYLCLQNSIRHNLSLHSRFEKIQNEGTGKSSWWQINHSASKTTGKSRRRATSMETPKFEKRRGRVKKVVEAMRNGLHPENTPSPSSSISESSDMIPVSPLRGFQFRLVYFRYPGLRTARSAMDSTSFSLH